jgi:hypothetical protein
VIIAGCEEDRDAARFNAVRWRVSSRSHSASDPRTPIIIRDGYVEHQSTDSRPPTGIPEPTGGLTYDKKSAG